MVIRETLFIFQYPTELNYQAYTFWHHNYTSNFLKFHYISRALYQTFIDCCFCFAEPVVTTAVQPTTTGVPGTTIAPATTGKLLVVF